VAQKAIAIMNEPIIPTGANLNKTKLNMILQKTPKNNKKHKIKFD
jgi:hypothetical protein